MEYKEPIIEPVMEAAAVQASVPAKKNIMETKGVAETVPEENI
jgi:hypothetical protein